MNQKSMNKLTFCWMLSLTAVLCMAWTTLKTNTPAGTDNPAEADDRMREIKAAFVERLDVDHYFTASATSTYDHADTGKHEFITLMDMAADPTPAAGYAHIYMKGDELFYQDDTDTTCQLTKDGFIEWESVNDVNNNTWIKSVDAAGTGTVNLIKADANDEQILPDGIRLATDAAPVQDEDVANKKYVDDIIASDVTMSAYTNEDSDNVAMVKSHAYKAQTAGFVTVICDLTAGQRMLNGYVGTTNDPAGAGTLVARQENNTAYDRQHQIFFAVAEGEYFEVTVETDTPTIYWKSLGTLIKPEDQD